MVWWMGRRMVEERERACDEAVLRAGSEPRIYAEAILNVCRFYTESRLAFVPGVSGANLRKRIEAIMNNNVASDLRPLQKFALALAGAAAVTLPILAGMVHLPALRAQSAAAPPTQAEREWRIQYARATFGNLAMVRTYTEYGRPDQIRDGNSDPRHLSQIWHYNYLADFHGSAEFEFAPPGRGSRMRIDFPPPLATFTAGSGRASIAVYTSKQDVTLTVPLDSLSGQVEMIGQVASNGRSVANVRDSVTAGPGAAQAQWQASFTLDPGSYSCHLLVREASGQLYAESIPFEVTK